MLAHAVQGLHMAFAGNEQAFAGLLPTGLLQQLLAQGLQAFARAGRERQARAFFCAARRIGLVPHVDHRHAGGQTAFQAVAMSASALS
jgi:hypothetical protein